MIKDHAERNGTGKRGKASCGWMNPAFPVIFRQIDNQPKQVMETTDELFTQESNNER